MGNSAGSLIGLELALNHPELVRGLILIEPSLGYDEAEREKLLAWNRELNEVQHYLPEIDRLKQLDIPVVIAVTERGRESIFATSSQTAAEQIGWPVVHFPGYHNAAKEMPLEFALMVHGICAKERK